ncbi:D-alanyl-D-alanine carboxypeptidase precursor [compost metagenome]
MRYTKVYSCKRMGEKMSGQSIMRHAVCMSVLLCTLAAAITSYGVVPANAEAKQEDKTAIDFVKIDQFIEQSMEQLDIPGAAIGIVQDDTPIYLKGYGEAVAGHSAVTPQTPFILGSTSKSFTALAVMQLVDDGRIGLDQPVQQYLPEFRPADTEASATITVRELLNQTSGIPTSAGVGLPSPKLTLEQLPAAQQKLTLRDNPNGQQFEYSNLNYDLLGSLIEAVSGLSFEQYMERHIFEPLGMKQTFASRESASAHGMAQGYQPVFGWMLPTNPVERPSSVPSGYILSSAEDMTRYLTAQMGSFADPQKKIISESSLALMHGKDGPEVVANVHYGMGWMLDKETYLHGGAVENFQSYMFVQEPIGVVLLLNTNNPFLSSVDLIAHGIRQIVNGEEPEENLIPSMNGMNWGMRLIALASLAFVARSLYVLLVWKQVIKRRKRSLVLHGLSIGLLHMIIPLLVLLGTPLYIGFPWELLIVAMPGFSHLLLYVSIILLMLGAIRLVLIIISFRRKDSMTRLIV